MTPTVPRDVSWWRIIVEGTKQTCRHFVRFRGDCVAKLFLPVAVDVVAKSPPQHRTRVGKPRQGNKEKTRKKRDA